MNEWIKNIIFDSLGRRILSMKGRAEMGRGLNFTFSLLLSPRDKKDKDGLKITSQRMPRVIELFVYNQGLTFLSLTLNCLKGQLNIKSIDFLRH